MAGTLWIGLALVVIGLIAAIALPGAGLVIGLVVIVIAVLLILGGIATARGRAPHPRP